MKKLSILFAAAIMSAYSFAGVAVLDGTAKGLSGSATTNETTITQGDFSYVVSAGAKLQAASGANKFEGMGASAILIGKTGKYIYNTIPFAEGITKFELYSNKGASARVSVSVSFSAAPLTKAQTKDSVWTAKLSTVDSVYNVTVPSGAKYFYYTVTNNNNSQVAFRITYAEAEGTVAKPTFTPAATDFVGSATVTLAAGEGLDIYYTLDGTEPTTTSTKYSEPFTLSATTTVKAIAYNATTSKASEVAEKTYTKHELMTCAEVNAAKQDAFVALNKVTVVYVNGGNTYVKDATGYALIYAYDFGLVAGQEVEGLQGTMDIYKNLPEVKPSVVLKDLTITEGTVPEPELQTTVPTMAEINKYVKFENVEMESGKFTKDGRQTVVGKVGEANVNFYNTFKIEKTFEAKKYNVIGFVTVYDKTIQIAVVSAEEVSEPQPAVSPYCQTEVGHFLAENADPNSYVLLSIGSKNGKTIVRIDQDAAKNNAMFDYLQVTGLATAGADVDAGGEKAMAVEFDTPAADAKGNITLEILWSTIAWSGRWMVQNVEVPATAECEHAVLVGPSTALDATVVAPKATKRLINGVLVIEKDGVLYTAQGAKL